jgi:hypothetical protein
MARFNILKDQLSRLKVFNDYIKKLEIISPIEADQTFVIEGKKLNIYGKGQTGQIQAVFDIQDVLLDPATHEGAKFGLSVTDFINFIEKTKADIIQVTVEKSVILIQGVGTKPVYRQTLIWAKEECEVDEIIGFIDEKLALPEFQKPIVVDISSYRDVISELASVTKFLDINQQLYIDSDYIKAADTACILKLKVPNKSIVADTELYLHRDLTALFKMVDKFTISDTLQWYYFYAPQFGVRALFVPKTSKWQYPTDTDIDDIVPEATQQIEVEIDTAKFYELLDSFEGVFPSESWRWKQFWLKVPYSFKDEIQVHFDDMKNEILYDFPVKVLSNTDKNENFQFLFPTLYFKNLKILLEKEPTFKLIFNSIDMHTDHGIGCILKNSELEIVFAKIEP